jgi:hypothetical protein
MASTDTSATIRLTNGEPGTHEVPAEVLARVLSGMQQLVYLTASGQEHRKIAQRFRLSEEIKQRYTLSCQIPVPGSYAMPLFLGMSEADTSLFTDYTNLLEKLDRLFASIQSGILDNLSDIFPDGQVRNRALREVRKLLPKPGEGWQLGLQVGVKEEVLLVPDDAISTIDRELAQDAPEDTVMTVTGELIRIDFDRRTVVLRYPPTRRELECVYVDELEETMLENRRGLIQATGQFTLDEEGNPTRLTNVTQLEPVDLSPITLKTVQWQGQTFRFNRPILLQPELDEESSQLYVVENADLALISYAQTREQLLQDVSEQIAFMWDAYVETKDALAPDALKLKQRLVDLCGVGRDAA